MNTVHESIVAKNKNTQTHRLLLSAFIREAARFEGKPSKSSKFDNRAQSALDELQEALEIIYGPFNCQSPKYIQKFADRRVDRINLEGARQQLTILEESIHRMDTLETFDYSNIDSAFLQLTKAREAYDAAQSSLSRESREGFNIFVDSGISRA